MYERHLHQFLSIYRFFAFSIAVVLTQAIPLGEPDGPDLRIYLILTALGVYTLLKVFSPIRWRHKGPMTYTVLLGDLAVSMSLVLYTGGLNSGFLLYGLLPVITAALLFQLRMAVAVAAMLSLSLVVAHTGLSGVSDKFVWVMEDNYLPLLFVYIIACFLIATLTYQTNLNIRQRIQSDAILDERRRIKQELHDGVAQTLTYLNLKIKLLGDMVSGHHNDQALDGLAEIRQIVEHTYSDIRESIDQLSAEAKPFPLIPTLSAYIKEFSRDNNIETSFDAPPKLSGVSGIAELQLLRIAQEGLTNIRKHAGASSVWISLDQDSRGLKMTVKDDGQGTHLMPPGNQQNGNGSRGLSIMRERAESLDGTLTITSTPGQGTEVSVNLPAEKVRI